MAFETSVSLPTVLYSVDLTWPGYFGGLNVGSTGLAAGAFLNGIWSTTEARGGSSGTNQVIQAVNVQSQDGGGSPATENYLLNKGMAVYTLDGGSMTHGARNWSRLGWYSTDAANQWAPGAQTPEPFRFCWMRWIAAWTLPGTGVAGGVGFGMLNSDSTGTNLSPLDPNIAATNRSWFGVSTDGVGNVQYMSFTDGTFYPANIREQVQVPSAALPDPTVYAVYDMYMTSASPSREPSFRLDVNGINVVSRSFTSSPSLPPKRSGFYKWGPCIIMGPSNGDTLHLYTWRLRMGRFNEQGVPFQN